MLASLALAIVFGSDQAKESVPGVTSIHVIARIQGEGWVSSDSLDVLLKANGTLVYKGEREGVRGTYGAKFPVRLFQEAVDYCDNPQSEAGFTNAPCLISAVISTSIEIKRLPGIKGRDPAWSNSGRLGMLAIACTVLDRATEWKLMKKTDA